MHKMLTKLSDHPQKTKKPTTEAVSFFLVGLQGLEPRIAVPETDVLPITP